MVRKRSFKADLEVVPDEWRKIAEQRKKILTFTGWSEPAVTPPAMRATSRRDDIITAAAETIECVIPLADDNGVGLEGVRVRLTAWPYRRNHDVTATLEVHGGRSFVSIARLDAWPPDPHMNVQARGRPGFGHLPAILDSHHVHRFADNVNLGMKAFGAGNLPLAARVDGRLESFRDFLRICGKEFNIIGLDQVDPPDWTVMI